MSITNQTANPCSAARRPSSLFALMAPLLVLAFLANCKSSQKKDQPDKDLKIKYEKDEKTGSKLIKVINKKTGKVLPPGPAKTKFLFENEKPQYRELFRVYIDSDEYTVRQLHSEKTIARKKDPGGDQAIRSDFQKFNLLDMTDTAAVAVQLSTATGGLARVSVEKVARITELTTLLKDDVTRWQFEFPKDSITPSKFRIYYYIALKGKLSKEEMVKYLKSKVYK